MRNIKITLEYDGSDYSGWQRQKNLPTVQREIEKAVAEITRQNTAVYGSGRTDAGVHAVRQSANFLTQSQITAGKMARALNSVLPENIAVISAEEADEKFHARASAKRKTYLYKILNRPHRSPLNRKTCWFISRPLDAGSMRAACKFVRGTKDFSVFAHADASVKTAVRTVFRAEVRRDGDFIIFTIEADGFLKRMVRLIVGTLAQVGSGRLSVSGFERIVKSAEKTPDVVAAPPQGLFLEKVEY